MISLLLLLSRLVVGTSTLVTKDVSSIAWGPCEAELVKNSTTKFLCGNLTVPLDYTDLDSGATHTLELVKAPALTKNSRGSVLMNFGGPGADGRKSLVDGLVIYRNVTGDEHDIIAWDPRGTARSLLRFSCYNTVADRVLATSPDPMIILLDDNDRAARRHFAQAKVLADTCYEKLKDVGRYIGTAFTARDAMSIVDALGEGPLIKYYGISYGTALGATIAAMFPDRIGAMVLDGVLNPHEYWNSYADISMVTDTDKAFRAMLQECLAAGKDRCALARQNATVQQLEDEIKNFVESLRDNPLPLPPSLTQYSSIAAGTLLDYSSLKTMIHGALYQPTWLPYLVQGLDGAMAGRLDGVAPLRNILNYVLRLTPEDESLMGIRCSDKSLRASTIEDLAASLEQGRKTSWIGGTGQIFGQVALPCSRWRFDAKERYTGDFRVKTKNPVLLISSTYDPVTPLASAHNVSSGFEGSVVVERKGFGHCSISQPSKSALAALTAYFQDGVLPEAGTQYEPDAPLF